MKPEIKEEGTPLKNLFLLIEHLQSHHFVSGTALSEKFHVSRTTIASWISDLEAFGLTIHRVKGKGYRLIDNLQLIDKRQLELAIPDQILKKMSVIDVFMETDSTNKTALESDFNDDRWKLFLAEYQHSGRGRRGRQWRSPIGTNLLFTLAKKSSWAPQVLYGASIITGIAIAKSLEQYSNEPIKIKWPNDIYIKDSKVAGILCEMQGNPADEAILVIGVGVNVFSCPELEEKRTTALSKQFNKELSRHNVLAGLTSEIIHTFEMALENIDSIFNLWTQYDYLLGKDINIHKGEEIISGVANGIDDKGQLQVILDTGTESQFNGGEVSVRW